GISVSRVGGAAQIKAMRQVAGKLRIDLAQYRELAAFAQFSSDLDKATRDQLTRGEKTTEILKQPQYAPLPVEKQVVIIWAATNGLLDDVETARIAEFESGLYRHLESGYEDLLPTIAKEKVLSDETTATLEKAVDEFKRQGGYGVTDDSAPAPASTDAPKADAAGTAGAAEAEEAAPSDASTTGEGEAPVEQAVDRDAELAEDAAADVATTDEAPGAESEKTS
ncbi:MAG TPA: hypothetical protein VHP64_05745, partial [Candidatus Limnocylindria bacterium]|nr:hypothetical protein [Candidatus Limnocylindria bacterium]